MPVVFCAKDIIKLFPPPGISAILFFSYPKFRQVLQTDALNIVNKVDVGSFYRKAGKLKMLLSSCICLRFPAFRVRLSIK